MKLNKYLLILTLSLLLLAPVFGSLPASAQTGTKPDTIVFVTEPDSANAITRLEDGELDIYAYTIADSALLARIEASPELDYYTTYGSYNDLTFNPAGPVFSNGKLNPFAVPEIREAMNYLIDRDYLAQNVLGGLFTPRWTTLNGVSTDAALLASEVRAIELQYAYNPQLAKQIIDGHMLSLGAVLTGGVWRYGGEPVEIIVLIRIEDERLAIGDYVADQLEAIGFQVFRDYKSAFDASPIWLGSDPIEGLFHIYTSYWIATVITRDLAPHFAFFYTNMGLPYPIWQAYVNTPEFYDLAQRLDSGDYATFEERQTMMARALELSMEDSVRIFLLDRNAFIPKQKDISLALDLYRGVRSVLWAKTIQRPTGGSTPVSVGIPSLFISPWNPVAGTNWIYDMMPIRGTADFGLVNDPYTGLMLPDRIERAEVVVQEDRFVQKTHDWVDLNFAPEIVVPQDAWADWDAKAQMFKTVGELGLGPVTAQRKSTVYYPEDLFETVTWHDGSPFSIADILMHMILTFDRGKPESDIYDESAVNTLDAFMSSFKGLKIYELNDQLVIETYSDAVDRDAEMNVTTWWPYYATGPGAWHALALGIWAEAAGEAAFSMAKADQDDLYYLDYVANDPIAVGFWNDWLENWLLDREVPYAPTLGAYISEDVLNTRLDNLSEWYEAYGHFWVGTGPYFLDSRPEWTFDEPSQTLTLQRFIDHPDPDDKWTDFADSPIPAVQIIGPDSIELGGEAVYDIFVTQGAQAGAGQLNLQGIVLRGGQPYPSKDIELVDYLLAGQNQVHLSGQAAFVKEGHYRVVVDKEMVSSLPGGEIRLEVIVVSKRVALPSTSGVGIDNQNHTTFMPLTLR